MLLVQPTDDRSGPVCVRELPHPLPQPLPYKRLKKPPLQKAHRVCISLKIMQINVNLNNLSSYGGIWWQQNYLV